MGGGGGVSNVAEYIQQIHLDWIAEAGDGEGLINIGTPTTPVYISIVDSMAAALDTGGNPFTGFLFTDTREFFDDPTDVMQAASSAIADRETWEEIVDRAVAKIDAVGILNDLIASTAADTARVEADDEIDAAVAKKSSGIDEQALWDAFVDAVVAKADEAGVLEGVDADSIISTAKGNVDAFIAAALSAADTGLNQVDDWKQAFDEVLNKVNATDLINTDEFESLVYRALGVATDAVREAISAAQDALDDDQITVLVQAYEQKLSYRLASRERQFDSVMSQGNAVNSSAYIVGNAIIQAQHDMDVAEYTANLSREAYARALSMHSQIVSALVETASGLRVGGYRLRGELLSGGISSMVEMIGNSTRFKQSLVELYNNNFSQEAGLRLQGAQVDKEARERFISQGAAELGSFLNVRAQYEQALIGLHTRVFSDYLQQEMVARRTTKESRERMLLQGVATAQSMQEENIQDLFQDANLRLQLAQSKHVAYQEFEGAQLDVDEKHALWDLQIWERGMNTLAGPAGMAASMPPKNSRFGSALTGAVGGIAAGASLGPVGALAGGVLGAAGALFS